MTALSDVAAAPTWKVLARKQARQPIRYVDNDGTLYSGCDNAVWKSTDQGDTWEQVHAFGGDGCSIVQVWKFENGRLLAASTDGRLWVSEPDDYSQWAQKLPLPDFQAAQFNSSFGLRVYKNIGMAAQYDPTFKNARNCFLSEDGGVTWRLYFTWEGPAGAMYHNHDVSYDPYSNLYWQCSGDAHNTENIRYSADAGATWHLAAPQTKPYPQASQIVVLPKYVLFISDNANVGAWRWDRDPSQIGGDLTLVQAQHVEDWPPNMAVPMADHATTAIGTPYGDLAYYGWFLGTEETHGGEFHGKLVNAPVVTTRDGVEFFTFPTMDKEPNGAGVTGVYGPDKHGNVWVAVENLKESTGEGYTNVLVNIDMWKDVPRQDSGASTTSSPTGTTGSTGSTGTTSTGSTSGSSTGGKVQVGKGVTVAKPRRSFLQAILDFFRSLFGGK